MNEYILHEQLLALENIASQYTDGLRTSRKIRQTVEKIKSQLYRVAVIGEFKRGKSSLVNAIIGSEVLPTDILPMTAAVTRVTYGEKRRILIRFKDGTTQERTVEELVDFATKYDAEKEKTAATIREIEVTYPSVFCKNHIDILDTPGLNDNESMTEVTMSILGDVDAAIMVISAKAPLSMTEQNLILDMIGRPQIRHIIFVVTHIDAVSNRASQQDKMIAFIQERLSGAVLDAARKNFDGQEKFLNKAEQILAHPDIFGVSSVLAMDGFTMDDPELLEESRFPAFKKELLALLTAAQSEDVYAQTLEAAEEVARKLERWHHASVSALHTVAELQQKRMDACNAYYEESRASLDQMMQTMDQTLAKDRIRWDESTLPRMYTELMTPYIQNLSAIRTDTNTDNNIRDAIDRGYQESCAVAQAYAVRLESRIRECMADVLDKFQDIRTNCGFRDEEFARDYAEWSRISFPELPQWQNPMPPLQFLVGVNVIPYVHEAVMAGLSVYAGGISHFVTTWRTMLQNQNLRDRQDRTSIVRAEEEIARTRLQEQMLNSRYEKNLVKLRCIREVLEIPE